MPLLILALSPLHHQDLLPTTLEPAYWCATATSSGSRSRTELTTRNLLLHQRPGRFQVSGALHRCTDPADLKSRPAPQRRLGRRPRFRFTELCLPVCDESARNGPGTDRSFSFVKSRSSKYRHGIERIEEPLTAQNSLRPGDRGYLPPRHDLNRPNLYPLTGGGVEAYRQPGGKLSFPRPRCDPWVPSSSQSPTNPGEGGPHEHDRRTG